MPLTPEVSLIGAMEQVRLLDLALALRLYAAQAGIGRVASALGCSRETAIAIRRGKHWQQDPAKVRVFNQLNGSAIPPETGIPSADDLKRLGRTPRELAETRAKVKAQQRAQRLEREYKRKLAARELAATARPEIADEDTALVDAIGRASILRKEKPPMRLDSAYFQTAVDETLWRIIRQLDDVKIGAMSGKELMTALASLLEKRALLRGEPTQIVRNDNRGTLEKVGELLLAEMVRRGLKPDLAALSAGGAK